MKVILRWAAVTHPASFGLVNLAQAEGCGSDEPIVIPTHNW